MYYTVNIDGHYGPCACSLPTGGKIARTTTDWEGIAGNYVHPLPLPTNQTTSLHTVVSQMIVLVTMLRWGIKIEITFVNL